ncbi:MAG: type II toxin-antitoxin system PemK/MazF family toxin [Myxococcales bacterium]
MSPKRTRTVPSEDRTQVRRGDVLWINCDPSVGVEPRKTRTCVVVSNDVANEFGAAVTVVPTQAFTAERASRVYMVDLRKPRSTLTDSRVANASMIMTYDRARIVAREGRLHRDAVAALDRALCVHLGLAPP